VHTRAHILTHMYTHIDTRVTYVRVTWTHVYVCACVPMRVLRHISKRGAECMRGVYMGWGERGKSWWGRGVRRGWCVVAMETPSPSLIIIWGKMARGLLPRVTPPPPFFPTPLFLPSLPLPSRWQLLLLLLPPRFLSTYSTSLFSSSPSPRPPPLPHLLLRLLLLRLLLLIRLHLAVSSHRGTYFARLGNIMLAPYRGDCVTILNSL